jgi:hypothetical protein
MAIRAKPSVPLSLVATFLTFLASGDDFNLARLVLPCPSSQPPADAFPEDDPNADFVRSAECKVPQSSLAPGAPRDCCTAQGAALTTVQWSSPFKVVSLSCNHLFLDGLLIPLRC